MPSWSSGSLVERFLVFGEWPPSPGPTVPSSAAPPVVQRHGAGLR